MFLSSSRGPSLAAIALALTAAAPASASALLAQGTTASTAAVPAAVDVGQQAPDFAAPGASRYGIMRDPVKLSDFRGKTVVLAFFFQARTKG